MEMFWFVSALEPGTELAHVKLRCSGSELAGISVAPGL